MLIRPGIVFKKALFILIVIVHTTNAQTHISFQDALVIARKNNLFFLAQKYNTDLVKADIITASLRPNPSLNLSAEQVINSKCFEENTGAFDPANRQSNIQVGKILQVAGQRKYKIHKAEKDVDIESANLSDYERNMLFDVANQWLDAWFALEKLEIVQRAKINSDTLLNVNQIRIRNQVITTTEFLRTSIKADQYQLMLRKSLQEYISELFSLKQLLGTSDSIVISDTEPVFRTSLPSTLDSAILYALHNRTDLLINLRAIEAAKVNLDLQKAIAFPQPEIGLNYNPQNKVPYLGAYLQFPVPVFDRNQGQVTRAKLQITQSESFLKAYQARVQNEVRSAYMEYQTNAATFQKYHLIYMQSETVLNTVRLSYLKGGTTILDYLEAERDWFEMQNQYYQALYDFRQSYIKVLIACNLISL